MEYVELLGVISTTEDNAVLCCAEGCGSRVYKRIHVIRKNSVIGIYGSSCAKKIFGSEGVTDCTTRPPIRSMERLLSARDMDMLQNNTEQLLEELRSLYDSMAEESDDVSGQPDYSTWTDQNLYDHCYGLAKSQFAAKRKIDPNNPGWKVLLRKDALDLYKEHRGLGSAGSAESNAYIEGRLSHIEKRGEYSNPYRDGTQSYLDFERGWSQAVRRSSS